MNLYSHIADMLENDDEVSPSVGEFVALEELGEAPSVCFRHMPSTPISRYINGDKQSKLAFQMLVCLDNKIQAYNLLKKIANMIEQLKHVTIVDGIITTIDVYTEPRYIGKTAKGNFTYSASFTAIIDK
ncbi:minor capsid protein [Bacillus phage vB_BpsS-140]|nr:minor capsid protein [Bacillus phage vB_BpsS-140]